MGKSEGMGKMMNPKTSKIMELTALSLKVNAQTDYAVHIDYNGKIDGVSVWVSENKLADEFIYHKWAVTSITVMDEVAEYLNSLLEYPQEVAKIEAQEVLHHELREAASQ
jgi:hypothetical protein